MGREKDLTDLTLVEFAHGYRSGDWTSEEVTSAHLARIARVDPGVDAYVTVDGEAALEAAREADRSAPPPEERPLLWGAPLALKDNICTRSPRTTCSSRFLENFRPPYDATVALRLRDNGAVILGKTNMDEFAMGSSTENSAFKPTRFFNDTATTEIYTL
jgi:aspartyl-tRNA(Asn)/glutamyl-tRNA(Gln) amidotransferase subunit A